MDESRVPRVFVVIPVFNRIDQTLICLAALRRQRYPAVSVIVVDGGSTDETVSQLEQMADVTVITDASGGSSVESHQVAIQRMIAAGVNMMTWMALASEWQRDWARTKHVEELTEVLISHMAGSGIAYMWEQQLLNTPVTNAPAGL